MDKIPLIGLTERELEDVAVNLGMPRFVGRQICQWLYHKGARSFDEMVNLSKKNKALLNERYCT